MSAQDRLIGLAVDGDTRLHWINTARSGLPHRDGRLLHQESDTLQDNGLLPGDGLHPDDGILHQDNGLLHQEGGHLPRDGRLPPITRSSVTDLSRLVARLCVADPDLPMCQPSPIELERLIATDLVCIVHQTVQCLPTSEASHVQINKVLSPYRLELQRH